MKDQNKTKTQLIKELGELRWKINKITAENASTAEIALHSDEQKKAPLRKAYEKCVEMENIINNSPAVVFRWRAAEGWPVEFVSDNVQQFGYTQEDFCSGRILFANIIHPEDLERITAEVIKYTKEGYKDFVQEYRIITKSGDIHWIDDRTWVNRDSNGVVTHYQGIVLDITERKQMEEALIQSEYKFRNLSEEIADGVAVTISGKNYWVNKAFTKIFGYSKEELIGKGVDFIIVPEEVPVLLKRMKDRLAGKDVPSHYETIAKCKDGRRIHIDVAVKVIHFENKQAIQIVVRDITTRKQTEKKIENLNRYATLSGVNEALIHIQSRDRFFDEVCKVAVEKGKFRMVWIGLLDEKTGLVKPTAFQGYVNGYFDNINISTKNISSGTGPTGKSIRDGKIIVNPNTEENPDIKPWKEAMLERGYMSSCSIPIKTEEGVIGALNLYSSEPYYFNEKELSLAEELAEDISFGLNHMEAEEALRDSEGKFRSVIEQSNDAIYVLQEDKFVFINPRFTEITGYSLDEISGDGFDYRQLVTENGKKALRVRETMLKQGKKPPNRCEFKGLRKDGRTIDLEVSVTSMNWGGAPANLGFIRDITERVHARKKLVEALEQAKRANKVKSLFLANMSHEIRTPLNAILGFTDLIKQKTQPLLTSEEQTFFEAIERNGERLLHTVHEVLDISQIEAGTFQLNNLTLNLNELVKKLVQEFQPMVRRKKLKLSYLSTVKDSRIKSDEYCISQALSNLIENAIKYTKEGKIDVSLNHINNKLLLSISDTGIGISEEYMDNLFELFSQESMGYTKKFQGVGLGLALTKHYLDMNNIGIEVESTKGVGTTFTLSLKPLKKQSADKKIKSKNIKVVERKEKPQEKQLILVVEDDISSQNLVKFFIRDSYNLIFATSVVEAKDKLKNNDTDLILLDLSLIGDEDGLDLAHYLRKTKKWQNIPIIALTAHAFMHDRERCLEAGCNDFLTKPIKQQYLLEKIKCYV